MSSTSSSDDERKYKRSRTSLSSTTATTSLTTTTTNSSYRRRWSSGGPLEVKRRKSLREREKELHLMPVEFVPVPVLLEQGQFVYLNEVGYGLQGERRYANKHTRWQRTLSLDALIDPKKNGYRPVQCLLTTMTLNLEFTVGQVPVLSEIPCKIVWNAERHPRHGFQYHEHQHEKLPNITIAAPRRLDSGFSMHHAKLTMVLYDNSVLRVAVSSSNLSGDWEYQTNATWLQDFDRKRDPLQQTTEAAADFQDTLSDYLRSIRCYDWANSLSQFDFNPVSVYLVLHKPGSHNGTDLYKYGHLRLRHLLQREQLPDQFLEGRSDVAVQCSSIGLDVPEEWYRDELGESLFASRTESRDAFHRIQPLVWPTRRFVRAVNEESSRVGGLTDTQFDCVSATDVSLARLGDHLHAFESYQRGRERVGPHTKTYFRFQRGTEPGTTNLCWALYTSANLSKAAWGFITKKDQSLFIKHYELGVLFLPRLSRQKNKDYFIAGTTPYQSPQFTCLPIPFNINDLRRFKREEIPIIPAGYTFSKSYASQLHLFLTDEQRAARHQMHKANVSKLQGHSVLNAIIIDDDDDDDNNDTGNVKKEKKITTSWQWTELKIEISSENEEEEKKPKIKKEEKDDDSKAFSLPSYFEEWESMNDEEINFEIEKNG